MERTFKWHEGLWKETCATRQAHCCMLIALLEEAARFRAQAGSPIPRAEQRKLRREICAAMRGSGDDDAYVKVLTDLAAKKLFG